MTSDSIAQLIYLGALGLLLGGGFFLANRLSLNKTLQMAATWVLIFVGVIAAVGLWGDIQDDLYAGRVWVDADAVSIPRASNGHYYLTLDINGAAIDFVVDTGATDIVLAQTDARAAGLDPDSLAFVGRAATANGEVATAPVRLQSVRIGPFEDRNVFAVVNEGDMDRSLLGMGYLQRWGRIEIVRGQMTLSR